MDTNVLLAAHWGSERSPNRELLQGWEHHQFTLLFSTDVLNEYIAKLLEKQVPRTAIIQLVAALYKLGHNVEIRFFHFPKYPSDPDDIPFLLCAANGNATHLITYDSDLLALDGAYPFRILRPLDFLGILRKADSAPPDHGPTSRDSQ